MAFELEKLYKFNALTYEQRADKLLNEGNYICSRERGADVHLFWMPDGEYWGEIWLKTGTTELVNIRSFIYEDALAWYPELVRMSEERLNEVKNKKFPGAEGLSFS
ncbi:hypothetical protein [Adhaeribacter aquaticus]|uniref:hypothetical protein n=1 Tax=Adhaeribacter aquaticus TaxID=299567 RepID=UPI00047C995F|nr:hypothetical protein [Adhaeribacter aquaticus]